MNKRRLIILSGPTAVGKTALSINIAKRIGAEIISADSMQVYRHMDIGSAKIKPSEMGGVRHYLIDCLDPTEDFNVSLFQRLSNEAMAEIYEKGKIPMIVGGTGFYIQAVLYQIDLGSTEVDVEYRTYLEEAAKERGSDYLHELLEELDPKSALLIPKGNVKRVIRALEYHHTTGEKISTHNARERERESPFDFRYYVLTLPRDILYQRIEERVDEMVDDGLFEEVEDLIKRGVKTGMTAMQGLGYRQAYRYFEGFYPDRESAIKDIKKETRHFAKRQLTWFRRERGVTFINKAEFRDEKEIAEHIIHEIQEM